MCMAVFTLTAAKATINPTKSFSCQRRQHPQKVFRTMRPPREQAETYIVKRIRHQRKRMCIESN